jgi:hypothetical protein
MCQSETASSIGTGNRAVDERAFDRVTRLFAIAGSRRDGLRALFGVGLIGLFADPSDAKKKRKKKRRKPCRGARPDKCGKACKNLATDPQNCGECGNTCDDGETCVNGACSCGEGRVICGGACVAGDCCDGDRGVTCAPGEHCCPEAGCRNRDTDPQTCGACGHACDDGESCVNGNCTCGEGRLVCGGECLEGNCCTGTTIETCQSSERCCNENGCKNLLIDADHCGECGNKCLEGETCENGLCVCGLGKIVCGDRCEKGDCCEICSAVTCPVGHTCCMPIGCRNLSDDPDHCGTCGIVCSGSSDFCTDSTCICKSNQVGDAACSGGKVCDKENGCQCPNLPTVPRGCGDCHVICPEDQPCGDDRCGCKEDQVSIEGSCQDCPPPPGIVLPGPDTVKVCDGDGREYCSCDGNCCAFENDCFIEYDRNHEPVREFCCESSGKFACGDQCCDDPACGQGCARQTARGGSYRRLGR